MAEDDGEFDEAERLVERGREFARLAGLDWPVCIAHYHLGIIAYGRGDLESARSHLEAARASAQALGDLLIPYWTLPFLALTSLKENDPAQAATLLHQALSSGWQSGLRRGDNILLGTMAVLAAAFEEWSATARLLGAATTRNHDTPFYLPERTAFLQADASARLRLGPEIYTEAWGNGRVLRFDALTDEMQRVLAIAEGSHLTQTIGHDPSILTTREQDVLRLLIDGRSNREIAELLFISPRTATTHVTHILAKFGVETRAAAVTYAFQHDLV
jgi:DNA-binding CsgD family transcriptional regulator